LGHALTAGAARVDITPPLSIPYLGFVPRHAPFTGVHDPLYARAVVAECDGSRVAILTADSIGWSQGLAGEGRDFVADVRQRVTSACGIPGDHVLVGATHAHSTPETIGLRRLLDTPGADAWIEDTIDRLASAVVLADRDRAPAIPRQASGQINGLSWSRRMTGKDGSLFSWQNRPQDDQIADWGTLDHEAVVILFEREGRPDIVMVHYACHPVTVQVQPLVSADFPGVAARFVESAGIGCRHCLFLQGACGDLNPVRVTTDFRDVERYGLMLAGETIKQIQIALDDNGGPASPTVRAASQTVVLPSRDLPPLGEVADAHAKGMERVERASSDEERALAERALLGLTERLERVRKGSKPVPAEVQAIRIGDFAFVGIPGEPFAEMGLRIKRESHARRALCLGYANGWVGYLAPPAAWEQGGYEVSLGTWSTVGPQAHELLLDAALELISAIWKT